MLLKNDLKKLCVTINKLNTHHPLWWQVFLEEIILNKNITYINNTTIIISVYEIDIQNIVIFYEVLKQLKESGLINKVINKREFVIVHFPSLLIMNYLIHKDKWLSLVAYDILKQKFSTNNLMLEPSEEEDLRFIYQGTIYHFYTAPKTKLCSNKFHKYIYLYKDLNRHYLNVLDNKLKYLRNHQEFWKNFEMVLENNFSV